MNRVDSTESDQRWPEFFELARSEGIRSILSYPLVVHNDGLGALNLYMRSMRAPSTRTTSASDEAFA